MRFREGLVSLLPFDLVDAGHEVGHVVLLDQVAVVRQRLALDRAPAGEGFREPREHYGLAILEIREVVGLGVRPLELEVGGGVADFQLGRGRDVRDEECADDA